MSYRIPTQFYFPQFEYLEGLIRKTQGVELSFYEAPNEPNALPVNKSFFEAVTNWNNEDFSHSKWMSTKPEILTSTGQKDVLSTIFYLVNCCQEWNAKPDDLDGIGRFKYESSLQHRFHVIQENIVQTLIDELLDGVGVNKVEKKSSIFISHDIDTIHGAWIQDGFALLKQKRIGTMMQVIFKEFLKSPAWFNMDQIIALNSEYGVQTTFFWLLSKGKGIDNVMNADYSIDKLRSALNNYTDKSATNGLHKASTRLSLKEEVNRCDAISPYNRYHFLKYNYVQLITEMEEAELAMDASFGFAEHYGFRTGFGLPFQPFNPITQKASSFLEVPLNLMDGTFHKYMQLEQQQIADTVISFITANNKNCVLSLLWHNTYFTDYKYKGFLEEYVKIMRFIKESNLETITPAELVKSYA